MLTFVHLIIPFNRTSKRLKGNQGKSDLRVGQSCLPSNFEREYNGEPPSCEAPRQPTIYIFIFYFIVVSTFSLFDILFNILNL